MYQLWLAWRGVGLSGNTRQAGVPVASCGAPEAQPAVAETLAAFLAATTPMPSEAVGEGEGVPVEGRTVYAVPGTRRARAKPHKGGERGAGLRVTED